MRIPLEHLPCHIENDVVVPSFLAEPDHPWLQRLIERAVASVGIRAGDIDEHLRSPLPMFAPLAKHRLAAMMLGRSLKFRVDAQMAPLEARLHLFDAVALSPERPRDEVLEEVARAHKVAPDALRAALFADLPDERVVGPMIDPPSPSTLAARANLWLAQAYVSRATRVRLDVKGASRPLVLSTKSKGLLCTVRGSPDESVAVLDLSGPLSLFKNTRLYGNALASLLPALAWCDRWILDAECIVGARPVIFRISTGAPIMPSDPPKRFDSKIEERFAKDFSKKKTDWQLIREPRPIVVGDGLIFPDFGLERDGAPAVFVELVGFWTPQYLVEKLAHYRLARLRHLILCVDEDLACADGDLPANARVHRFRRRVDVDAVLALAEASLA